MQANREQTARRPTEHKVDPGSRKGQKCGYPLMAVSQHGSIVGTTRPERHSRRTTTAPLPKISNIRNHVSSQSVTRLLVLLFQLKYNVDTPVAYHIDCFIDCFCKF